MQLQAYERLAVRRMLICLGAFAAAGIVIPIFIAVLSVLFKAGGEYLKITAFFPQLAMLATLFFLRGNLPWNHYLKVLYLDGAREVNILKALAWGIAGFGIVCFGGIVTQMLMLSLGMNPSEVSPDAKLFNQDDLLFTALFATSAIALAPLCEELIFRLFVNDGISALFQSRFGAPFPAALAAACATAFIFAGIHFELQKLIPLFLLSLFLQFLRARYKNMYYPIIAHTANNFIAVLILLIFMSF